MRYIRACCDRLIKAYYIIVQVIVSKFHSKRGGTLIQIKKRELTTFIESTIERRYKSVEIIN